MKQKTNVTTKIKSMVFVLSVLAAGIVSAQTVSTGPNSVYIEQLGNTNTVTIEQVGGTNRVGGVNNTTPSNSNYATINGSSNNATITQTGDDNLEQYYIRGNNNNYNVTTTGDGNTNKTEVGNSTSPNNLRNNLTVTVTGDTNAVTQNVIGNDITSVLTVTGNLNEVNKRLNSTNGTSTVTITGSSNKVDSEQIDVAGAAGHQLTQMIAGDYNSIVTQQQGTNDTTVDIRVTGDHNTVTVRTSSATIINPNTAIAR
jgi:hypothetical protein